MPQTICAEDVRTFAVVGGRGAVAGWFAERGLHMDALRTAETSTVHEGVRRVERYVGLDELTGSDADRFDHIVHV